MDYVELWHRLIPLYDAGEAKAIVRLVLDVRFGLSHADILCGKMESLSTDEQIELQEIMLRLEKGEPVQYILGSADFYGRSFHVAPGVLIPRPETEELCRRIISEENKIIEEDKKEFLDIGTGSGCIAITLALEVPGSSVTGWDISEVALSIANDNARHLGADVTFERQDILNTISSSNKYDLIVSNPPYICDKEKNAISSNVLNYEPYQALFVPDSDPLLYYRSIAIYAVEALKPNGTLYFELNAIYANEVEQMLLAFGFKDAEIWQDQFEKQRFLRAKKI